MLNAFQIEACRKLCHLNTCPIVGIQSIICMCIDAWIMNILSFYLLHGKQARLTLPVLLVTLAVTPPFLLRSVPVEGASLTPQEARRGYSTPVWQVNCVPPYLPTNLPIHGTSCHKYPPTVNYCVNMIALSAGLRRCELPIGGL